jgi:hypothetical protein
MLEVSKKLSIFSTLRNASQSDRILFSNLQSVRLQALVWLGMNARASVATPSAIDGNAQMQTLKFHWTISISNLMFSCTARAINP